MYEDLYIYNTSGVTFPTKIVLSGISYCDGTYKIDRPNSGFSAVEYVLSGTGTIFCGGKKYTASAGDTYFLPYGEDQLYYSSSSDPWTKIFFNLDGSLGNTLAEEYDLSGRVIFPGCNTEKLMREIFELRKSELTPIEMQQKSLMLVHRVFMEIHKLSKPSAEISPELQALKDYIDIHINDNISLDELANVIFRSKNYVIDLFKDGFGQTPYRYFWDKKMELSKRMLANTSMPIQQISEYLKFSNSQYFSNSFKKKYGISPFAYRKRKQQIGK